MQATPKDRPEGEHRVTNIYSGASSFVEMNLIQSGPTLLGFDGFSKGLAV